MTDNEIIKALESCNKSETIGDCQKLKCPLITTTGCRYNDEKGLRRLAIALINRQKAKIEALQMDNAQIQSDNINANMNLEHLQADIERLKGWQDLLKAEKHSLIKAEAIKEFAERIKQDAFYKCGDMNYTETCDLRRLIDKIVKEMVGEDNG